MMPCSRDPSDAHPHSCFPGSSLPSKCGGCTSVRSMGRSRKLGHPPQPDRLNWETVQRHAVRRHCPALTLYGKNACIRTYSKSSAVKGEPDTTCHVCPLSTRDLPLSENGCKAGWQDGNMEETIHWTCIRQGNAFATPGTCVNQLPTCVESRLSPRIFPHLHSSRTGKREL